MDTSRTRRWTAMIERSVADASEKKEDGSLDVSVTVPSSIAGCKYRWQEKKGFLRLEFFGRRETLHRFEIEI